jgi:hypothetical protein
LASKPSLWYSSAIHHCSPSSCWSLLLIIMTYYQSGPRETWCVWPPLHRQWNDWQSII